MLPLIRISREVKDSMPWDDWFYIDCLATRHNILRSLIAKYDVNDVKSLNKILDTTQGKYLKKGSLDQLSIEDYDLFISKMILMGLNYE